MGEECLDRVLDSNSAPVLTNRLGEAEKKLVIDRDRNPAVTEMKDIARELHTLELVPRQRDDFGLARGGVIQCLTFTEARTEHRLEHWRA